jgi:hypothetical protein
VGRLWGTRGPSTAIASETDMTAPNDADVVRLTREELYQQVWLVPMRTLAQRFGLSDVGLAKTCKRMVVPVPGRGYWANKAAGKRVKQIPLGALPPNSSSVQREVQFGPRISSEDKPPLTGPVSVQAEFESRPENLIVVSDALRSPHPIVRKTMDALKGSAKTEKDYVGNWREPHLNVHVSRDLLPRALRIMDALVKAFHERGWTIAFGSGDDRKSYVVVEGQRVPFGIREKIKKVRNEPAKPIRSSTGEWYTPYHQEFRNEPSGRLSLVLRNRWGNSVDKSWDDGASWRVEDRLNEFVLAIVARAEEDREWDRRRAEAERARMEEERRRYEAARRREAEATLERELDRQADNWRKSQRLAAYIAAVRQSAAQAGGIEPGSALEQWLQWGERYAHRIDPLSAPLASLAPKDLQ